MSQPKITKRKDKVHNKEPRINLLNMLEQIIKKGRGEITAQEWESLLESLTTPESKTLHEIMDSLIRSGNASVRPHVVKIHDKGLIISGKLMVRLPSPEKPSGTTHPLIMRKR